VDHFQSDSGGAMKLWIALLLFPIFSFASDEIEAPSRWGLTAGISLPQPLTVGGEWIDSSWPELRYFFEGGYFSLPMSSRVNQIDIWSVQVGARYFPLQNWVYASGGLGFRHIGLGADISSLKMDGVSLANDANLSLNAVVANLCAGGQWQISKRFSLAAELGFQIPIPGLHGGSTTIVQEEPDGTDLSVDDSDALKRVTGISIPQIALIRFIWYIE
jgi:hypothetical protein